MPICYDQLAAEYAAHRKVHPEVVRELVFGGQLSQESRVLEIGCGTGNYVVALNAAVGCQCWGVDPSLEMLSRASEQNSSIRFGQGYGEALAFADGCFDFVFSVDVIHHLPDPVRAFDESHRVLTLGGKVCTVTDSEWIIRHREPLPVYFPSTVAVDLRRIPAIPVIEKMMQEAGFTDVGETTVEHAYSINDIQAYRDKAFSSLHLIPEDEFRHGIERMEDDLKKGPIGCISPYIMLWGTKRTNSRT